ncbi:MAG: carotenoid biosynthesis protein [Deltaproteobacteria bacterium]|nr:carotenoid biosynthesis protein [Deltaproteobacteria bacterium]
MEVAYLMLVNRPAVLANLAAFAILALAERGVRRMLLWLVTGTAIGWLVEFSSTHTGFPFGYYVYHQESFAGELAAGGVPIFASLSFAALTYLGYSSACTLLSPLRGAGAAVRRVEPDSLSTSWRLWVLAAVLITWMDIVIDPITLLGRYWHLGDLYHYEPAGIHFGVPLSNYGGWLFTALVIVGINQLIDARLRAAGSSPAPLYSLPFQPFWSVGGQAGTYVYMICVTLYLLVADVTPAGTPLMAILLSTLTFTGAYAVFTTAMIRRGFSAPAADSGTCAPLKGASGSAWR